MTTDATYVVRHALPHELPRLSAIEQEAGGRFETLPALADLPALSVPPEVFGRALARAQLWVAVADGDLIGFACADLVDDAVHLEELDVVPAWGRRGVGRALVEAVIADARARGCAAATLTTFRDVPWNAPFYARLGFRVLAPAEVSSGLATIVAHEAARGLPPALRVVMRRAV